MKANWVLKVVVAIAGAVLMALEILGSRVLAPSYGSSVYVWGSLISTFLTALALGYAFGGRLADRRPSPAVLSIILSLGAVLILPCIAWGGALLRALVASGLDARWSVLTAAVLLFLPASSRNAGEMAAKWKLRGLVPLADGLIHSPEPPAGTAELTDAHAPVEALQHF